MLYSYAIRGASIMLFDALHLWYLMRIKFGVWGLAKKGQRMLKPDFAILFNAKS